MSSTSAAPYDVIFIGAGHNALVAAAYLTRAGRRVCLLERADVPGGWVRSEELTLPGRDRVMRVMMRTGVPPAA